MQNLRTWVEIDRTAISKNFKTFRSLISPQTKFMAVLKSNAYGHDMLLFAREMEELGADWLGVDDIDEALDLRKAAVTLPILVLGYTLPSRFAEAAEEDISITVSNFKNLDAVLKLQTKKKLKIHIKVDTGLNRQGFLVSDLNKVLDDLNASRSDFLQEIENPRSAEADRDFTLHASIEGLYTHFAAAESLKTKNYTLKQIESFKKWKKAFEDKGFKPLCHTAGTAAAIVCPESHFDLARFGIGLYGLWPSEEIRKAAESKIKLSPVLTWKAIVADVKNISTGCLVGYDCTEAVKRDSTIAVIPVGYWHGYPRHLSSLGTVLINGALAKVLGRVSMDMIVVDVTDIPNVMTGDEAVLVGKQGRKAVPADEVAATSETIHYEIVTRINPLIKRLYQ